MSSLERRLLGRSPQVLLYCSKIIIGTALGLIFGFMGIMPKSLLESLLFLAALFALLSIIIIFFRWKIRIRESFVRLFFLHGTLGYFACVLAFWGFIINL